MGRRVNPAVLAGFVFIAVRSSLAHAEVSAPPVPKAVSVVSLSAVAGADAVFESGRKVY